MEMSITGSALIIKKQFVENWLRYLLATLVLGLFLGGAIIFYSNNRKAGLGLNDINAIFQVINLLAGGIFVVSLFEGFSGRQRQAWLSLPVSAVDRIACILLYSVILFPVVFCAIFSLVMFVAMHSGHTFNEEVTPDKFNVYREGLAYYPRLIISQSVIAVLAVMYRRYAYLKVALTFFVLLFTFTTIYKASLKRIFGLPKGPADIDYVDVADYPENWRADETVTTSFMQITKDDSGRVKKQRVKDKVAGQLYGSLYGFVGIGLATNESAIMPVSRYFNADITGTISKEQRWGLTAALYIGLIALWTVVWLRFKEAQL